MSLISAGRDAYKVDPDGIRFVMCEPPLHVVYHVSRAVLADLARTDLRAGKIDTDEIMTRTFLRRRKEIETAACDKHDRRERAIEIAWKDFMRLAEAA